MANYELRIETSEFKKALDVLSTVINKKNALPILADALVKYDRQRKLFTMTASNTEQTIVLDCWRPDEQADNGQRPWLYIDRDDRQQPFDAICIHVETFREAFDTLPAMPVICQLKLGEQGGSLCVTYNKGEFTLPVELATDYPPQIGVVEKGGEGRDGVNPLVKFAIKQASILPTIIAARCCVANDELRPVLNTVCIECFHDHAVVASTDGHSLFKSVLDMGMGWLQYGEFAADGSTKLLVPKQSFSALAKTFATAESLIVTADTQRIRFATPDGTATLTTVTIDGSYPNYDSVIPKNSPHKLLTSASELAVTLRRVQIFADEGSNMCILRRSGEHVEIETNDAGLGRNAAEQVTIINEDDCSLPDRFQVGCKIATLQKLIACVASDNVVLEFTGPSKPILLREDDKASSLTLLAMPMLVNE